MVALHITILIAVYKYYSWQHNKPKKETNIQDGENPYVVSDLAPGKCAFGPII